MQAPNWKIIDPDASPGAVEWDLIAPIHRQDMVLIGKDEWLFLQRDSNDVIGQHTGRVHLGEAGKARWREAIESRASLAARLGTAWLMVVPPDKEGVYPEFLPDWIVPAGDRPVHDVLDICKSVGVPAVYPLERLKEAKREGPVYAKIDTHWNQRGAYETYVAICETLESIGVVVRAVDADQIEWLASRESGDLRMKLFDTEIEVSAEARQTWVRGELDEHRAKLIFDNRIVNIGRVAIFEQASEDLPVCVVFGDSFALHLLLFLKESFRRLIYVHSYMFVEEVVAAEHPDVVINISVERFLIEPPEDHDAMARLRNTASHKAANSQIADPLGWLGSTPVELEGGDGMLIPW